MDFGWPIDIRERVESARRFAEENLSRRPTQGFDHSAWRAVAKFGVIDSGLPQAPVAGLFLVLARQYRTRGPFNFTAFLVPSETPGLVVSPVPARIGLPGAPLGQVRLNDCLVAPDALAGPAGAGLKIFATAMQWERSCLLAGFLGAAERDLVTCGQALQRKRDGDDPLLNHQAVSHRLARMKLRLDSARLLVYRAAWSIDQGHEDSAAAAMAKLAASEAVVEAASDSIRLMAGSAWLEPRARRRRTGWPEKRRSQRNSFRQ